MPRTPQPCPQPARSRKLLTMVGCALSLCWHAHAQTPTESATGTHIPSGMSRVVIYNPAPETSAPPGLVRVNSAYVGILHAGYHTVMCLPPQMVTISLHGHNRQPDEIDMGPAVSVDLGTDTTHFVRVRHSPNEPLGLENTPPNQALPELRLASKELATRTRLKDYRPCGIDLTDSRIGSRP